MNKIERVAAVVVTYNRSALLDRCLDSIAQQTRPIDAVHVVDNASTDDTVQLLAEKWPGVVHHRLPENLGPAGGYAFGVEHAMAEGCNWLWLFNDDDEADPDALSRLLKAATGDPGIGLVAPWSRDAEGNPQPEGHRWRYGRKRLANDVVVGDQLADVDIVTTSASLIRTKLIDSIGNFDATFFMMNEDDDFCLRARSSGWRVCILPRPLVRLLHVGSPSLTSPPWRGYYQTRNHLFVVQRRQSMIDLFAWVVRQLKFVIAILLVLDRKRERLRYRSLGAWHGIRGTRGPTIQPH